ncbi:hypothetical protein [Caenimonas aquaedulcis]|uniref:DUF4019 domain-containing protein n=1 Tax=Caenimonas aquaedulcis TaxID=2793270 RepID=A0A931MIP1_9BURK|nr:hypothetical protein [Caenimonas aquaedulcis]MBG9390212.1 hypothetical protein [Caenimonas aquaedulcis]
MSARFAALALLAMLAACGGGGETPEDVAMQRLQEELTRSFPAGTYVFRSQAEMAAAWNAAPQEFGDAKPMPAIDFSQSMVVGISMGVGIRCFVPTITAVTRVGASYTVSYRANDGSGGTTLACLHTWRLTDFVAVPAQPGTVAFQRVPG